MLIYFKKKARIGSRTGLHGGLPTPSLGCGTGVVRIAGEKRRSRFQPHTGDPNRHGSVTIVTGHEPGVRS